MNGTVFEAGVTIHLVDKVSGALGQIARQFTSTQSAATALNTRLNSIASTFKSGLIMAGGGAALAAPLILATNHAKEYVHQLNQMNSAGLTHHEMAESVAAAWSTSRSVVTSTARENLKVIMD